MYYTRLQVICNEPFAEILMAEISEIGFDTFMETENGFEAYAEERKFQPVLLERIKEKYAHVSPLIIYQDKIQKQNWNEQWEKSIEPIIVEDQCIVRAEFHQPDKNYPFEIVITPKMSFGTGHHATTYLMLKNQLAMDHKGKFVMDAGCGSAILSVMACKCGASHVEAFDIDEWSTINGKENLENNKCKQVNLRRGTIRQLTFLAPFDIILANINKNVLLDEMDEYAGKLKQGGLLLLSGFYSTDVPDLLGKAVPLGFKELKRDDRDNWCSLLLKLH